VTAIDVRAARDEARFKRPRRARLVTWILAGLVLAVIIYSLASGTVAVPIVDALRAAVGMDTGSAADFIVGEVRAPRVFTAAMVGALLGLSGAVLQSVVRNELASPDILGISEGAAAGAVIFIFLTGITSSLAIAPSAVLGAITTSALIVVLGSRGRLEPMRMIIAGIGVSFVAMSTITYLLTRIPERLVPHAYAWTVGSTNARTWQHVALGVASLVVLVPVAAYITRPMRGLEMGDDLAASLGVRVRTVRLGAVGLGAVAAGLGAALVGPVAFIALVAPALARRLTRSGAISPAPAMLMGAVLLLLADFAARELFSPTQLPVGLFTALVGAPYLVWLLVRNKGAFS
jgi:iron complex transport system permease protein